MFITAWTVIASALSVSVPYPVLSPRLRVKQHRAGAEGNLVPGEEEFIKIILGWEFMETATAYEVCENCDIDSATGVRATTCGGTVEWVDKDNTCGGQPCWVRKQCPVGINTFAVRATLKDGG